MDDIGSGLAYKDDDKSYLRGIVGNLCTLSSIKGHNPTDEATVCSVTSLFTDLTWYMAWIVENVDFSP